MDDKFRAHRNRVVSDARSFNHRLSIDRRQRLPFLDPHTGIAQTDCSLWLTEADRIQVDRSHDGEPAPRPYCYPAQRWHKRRREYLIGLGLPGNDREQQQHPSKSQASPSRKDQPLATSSLKISNANELLCNGTPHGDAKASLFKSNQNFQTQRPFASHLFKSDSVLDFDSRDQSASSQLFYSPRPGHSPLIEDFVCDNRARPFGSVRNGPATECRSNRNDHTLEDDSKGRTENDASDIDSQSKEPNHVEHSNANCKAKNPSFKSKASSNNRLNSRSDSILVKDSREFSNDPALQDLKSTTPVVGRQFPPTNHDVGPDGKPSSTKANKVKHQVIKENGNRPYVCPICDQTYKTRPGLSYHFIHKHDTTLPRSCSGKRGSLLDATCSEHNSSQTAPKKTKSDQKLISTARVLRSKRGTGGDKIDDNQEKYQESETLCHSIGETCVDCSTESNKKESDSCIKIRPDQGSIQDCESRVASPTSSDGTTVEASPSPRDPSNCNGLDGAKKVNSDLDDNHNAKLESSLDVKLSSDETKGETNPTPAKLNLCCDFCLGTTERNRRTRLPEELISCSNCGSSGHPSCLRFSENTRLSVRKYNWQCIDCKTCSTCNKADNEDQLLFCDDCDRSYHTYCLSPPLDELPEGSWSCNLCITEYRN